MPVWEYCFVHFSPDVLRDDQQEASNYPPFHDPFTVPTGGNILALSPPAPALADGRLSGVGYYINGQRQRVHAGDVMEFKYACFAELGQQGWELAAIEYGQYIFKRPCGDDAPFDGTLRPPERS
jgi:hypothetical protein